MPSLAQGANVPRSAGLYAHVACIWEATARKPGNVHPYRDFAGASYVDFLLSAAAIAPVLDRAPRQRVGTTILEGVYCTREVVSTNTNLGILLLLAPLASVPLESNLPTGLAAVLDGLDVEDARQVYAAIRLAAPAGLGRVAEQDIRDEPTLSLRQVMALAADRDLVARQYTDSFHEVLNDGVPALRAALDAGLLLEAAIIRCHLHLMAAYPDSLIARKCGLAEAEEAAARARRVLDAGWPGSSAGNAALLDLDSWLRAAGHSRNPGTTADLVTASLFAAVREGTIVRDQGLRLREPTGVTPDPWSPTPDP
jgi:triphosphoribosyl-dephospho-CoA synthase